MAARILTEERARELREYKKLWARAKRRPLTEQQKREAVARTRKWAAANPLKVRTIKTRWAANNREQIREGAAAYRKANKAICDARIREWTTRNKPRIRAAGARREAAEIQATPSWLTAIQRAQIQEYYDVAEARNVQTNIVHHVDHICPLQGKTSRGLHVPWNLQVLTATDNLAKANKLLDVQHG